MVTCPSPHLDVIQGRPRVRRSHLLPLSCPTRKCLSNTVLLRQIFEERRIIAQPPASALARTSL